MGRTHYAAFEGFLDVGTESIVTEYGTVFGGGTNRSQIVVVDVLVEQAPIRLCALLCAIAERLVKRMGFNKRVCLTDGIVVIARPAIIAGCVNHPGANGI